MDTNGKQQSLVKKYSPLATAAGVGSMLGSGCIVGLSATIPVWQKGLNLSAGQVGLISGALTFAIAFGSLFAGQITKIFGLIRAFNWINLFYAIGAAICVFSGNFVALLLGVIVMGIASGADLPISLTVVSHDAPDEKTSASFFDTNILANWYFYFLYLFFLTFRSQWSFGSAHCFCYFIGLFNLCVGLADSLKKISDVPRRRCSTSVCVESG